MTRATSEVTDSALPPKGWHGGAIPHSSPGAGRPGRPSWRPPTTPWSPRRRTSAPRPPPPRPGRTSTRRCPTAQGAPQVQRVCPPPRPWPHGTGMRGEMSDYFPSLCRPGVGLGLRRLSDGGEVHGRREPGPELRGGGGGGLHHRRAVHGPAALHAPQPNHGRLAKSATGFPHRLAG